MDERLINVGALHALISIPCEHKRGRAAGKKTAREAWATDRVQVGAFARLVGEAYRQRVEQNRVRYHADAVTVHVPIDVALRAEVAAAVERARSLRRSVERPRRAGNVISRNHVEGWGEVPQRFRIIGGGGIAQAPVSVASRSGTFPEGLPEIVGDNGDRPHG